MKTATLHEIKKELNQLSQEEVIEHFLRVVKFKKENKELLTYLLFESSYEEGFIAQVKAEMDQGFAEINLSSFYFVKKTVRKILRTVKKYSRYSGNKQTEVELLLHFCRKMAEKWAFFGENVTLTLIYERQLGVISKLVSSLHEDLQYDYTEELKELRKPRGRI
ncbi:MAG: hypothetical protein H6581_14325 [Bacteroidia bacterium]|nr:hypothetical protein [Bacteroidia bacterium]